MRKLSGTHLAATLAGATALTTAASITAYAHDGETAFTPTKIWEAATLDLRTPLNADVFHEFLDAKLDKLAAMAEAMRAKVAAIPADTVLSNTARHAARAKLAKVAFIDGLLDALPDSGLYAPTAAEQAQVAAIRADLNAIVQKVKTLLANKPAPAVSPVTTKVVQRDTLKVLSAWWLRDHHCDGDRDGDRTWDGRWSRH